MNRADPAVQDASLRTGRRRVLATLCVTQVTSWGVLYYAFPVLAGYITADTGWATPTITAALSASQLMAALVGIPVGRWLDQHGPRGVMSAGSLLAAPAVVAIATAQSLPWFFAAWLLAGTAMGAVLYPPAFAAVTRWFGPRRVRALTVLTLAAGLASTIFAPITAALAERMDWRGTYLVLGGILAVVTVPGHWWGLRLPWPHRPPASSEEHGADPRRVARSGRFVLVTLALSLGTFSAFAVLINLVPLLVERGVDTGTAALALGLGGAGQVVGRLGYGALARYAGVRARTALVLFALAVTTVALGVFSSTRALVTVAVVAGMARGLLTLLQATAVTDRWGARHYGRLTGLLSAPLMLSMALSPFFGAALAAQLGGYGAAFFVLGAVSVVATVLSVTADSGRKTAP